MSRGAREGKPVQAALVVTEMQRHLHAAMQCNPGYQVVDTAFHNAGREGRPLDDFVRPRAPRKAEDELDVSGSAIPVSACIPSRQ